jgi:hypothetical protein
MKQKDGLGGGISNDDRYETWEIKECGSCGRLAREYYSVRFITQEESKSLKNNRS